MDFVTDGSAFKINGAAGVLPVFKDIPDGRLFPPARVFREFLCMFPADGFKIGGWGKYLFFFQLPCNLHCAFSRKAQGKNLPYGLCRRFVDYPLFWVIEDYATDSESGTEERIYNRLPKYADLGGYETDFNGACTFYTVDEQTTQDMGELIERLNLTAKQAKVLQLRLCGYGDRAIATYLGVTLRAVQKTRIAIQGKITDNK